MKTETETAQMQRMKLARERLIVRDGFHAPSYPRVPMPRRVRQLTQVSAFDHAWKGSGLF
jgi:hypothetical protein